MRNEEAERIEREEDRKLELKRREEYLIKLFECEARDREELLRKVRGKQEYLRGASQEEYDYYFRKG
ncbi:hypothetical protein O5404_05615 (plasmid) [Borrelia miyamotoi]|uniref:Uncharacterized protein n=1 Tax=Borrelia miyamotoi TaxID=47466 RepID=A0AAX3JPD9_9SPIR|nr:hypothetical protein [Borrelia miyamotoi]WAZ72493.1 hypothetical protein O5404_05615 [Borrelia miyamotoi]WVI05417.1 hypothetical protein F9Y91_00930 [Borrelia miyamotoi]